jgi:hypothetical protein
MFNKLYQDGVEGDMLSLMNNMYKGMTFKVKWDNHLTDNINIAQGIRQGTKLLTLLYKRYNNTILNSLTISTLGAKFGDIGVASPACADDIVLLGPSTEMQAMIDVVPTGDIPDRAWRPDPNHAYIVCLPIFSLSSRLILLFS